MRVIRNDYFIEDYVHPNSKTKECTLKRGGHYTDTALERTWRGKAQEQSN